MIMSKRTIFGLLLLALCLALTAQEVEQPSFEDLQLQIQAMSDSLLKLRESEVISAYGFKETDKLTDVAAKLEISNLEHWKEYLGIEPKNEVLDKMSLRKLGITPFRAFLAQQYSIYGFTELSSIGELAAQKQLPVKKVRQFAGIDSEDRSFDDYSLQALNRTPEEFVAFEKEFNAKKLNFGAIILGFGILTVFVALAVTALVVGQLKRLNPKPKKADSTLVVTSSGKVKAKPVDMNSHVIAAAIATLHFHKHDIEERRRLLLTFRRAGSDQWRSSMLLNMPNREILRKRS